MTQRTSGDVVGNRNNFPLSKILVIAIIKSCFLNTGWTLLRLSLGLESVLKICQIEKRNAIFFIVLNITVELVFTHLFHTRPFTQRHFLGLI